MYNTFFMDISVSSFVFPLSLKSVDLVVPRDGFLCVTEIVCIFHSGYFDYRYAFRIVLDLEWADNEA